MAYPYITQADLEARISAQRVKDILDDDNSGTADATAVTRILADASAKVAGVLRGIYDLTAVATTTPEEVKRLALDVAVVYAAQRHPEVVRRDWQPLLKAVQYDLESLRTGKTRLDVVSTPEPAANEGGSITSTVVDDDDQPARVFDNMGDF